VIRAALLAGLLLAFAAVPPRKGRAAPPGPDAGCPVVFRDAASAAGLDFRHDRGATPEHRLPETMGSGLAWLDYDGDGCMDLFAVQSVQSPKSGGDRLYRNNCDGTFTDVTARAGFHLHDYGMGAAAADFDNDGHVDLYVTDFGANVLYRNNGDGTFTDVTTKAGLAAAGWSTSAAWADFDGDGFLDLFVARYVDTSRESELFCGDAATGRRDYCDPKLYPGTHDLLFHNNGDGTFTDISESSGIAGAVGKGLGVVASDLDEDGRPDLYVANDTTMNFLFHNLGGGRFEDASLISGAGVNAMGRPSGGMGVNAGDLSGNGRMDLIVANFEAELNGLYRNLGSMIFEDAAAVSGFGDPSFTFSGFGLDLLDADNDGDLDVFVANGHVLDRPHLNAATRAERPFLLWNDGHGRFRERGCGDPFRRDVVARGSAVADFDNDGDPDVAVSVSGGPIELLRNGGSRARWVGVVLAGTASNREGIGARLTLETDAGRQVREVRSGGSYLSSGDPRVLFGLAAGGKIRRLTIRWPSGRTQEVTDLREGSYNRIVEPSASASRRP
jgi:hypothetical protein